MKIAIFGRTINSESLRELSEFVQELTSVGNLEVFVYKPFKSHVLSLLREAIANQSKDTLNLQCIENFFERAGEFLTHSELPADTNFFFSFQQPLISSFFSVILYM